MWSHLQQYWNMDQKLKGCLHTPCVMGHVIKLLIYEPLTCHSGKSSHPARTHTLFLALLGTKVRTILSPARGIYFSFFYFLSQSGTVMAYMGGIDPTQTSTGVVNNSLIQCFSSFCKKKKDFGLKTNTLCINNKWIPRWKMCMSCVCRASHKSLKSRKHNSTYLGIYFFFLTDLGFYFNKGVRMVEAYKEESSDDRKQWDGLSDGLGQEWDWYPEIYQLLSLQVTGFRLCAQTRTLN